ncbi:MAG: hypothetical protein M0Q12_14495 [Synergistaceae bacterium]|jgi:DNA (cytosine-5)-methyltransferase 1|nr:hypothetical protein [Synergistaceae bacterium]
MTPRLLDLFCGAGGAAKGYQRAGFYVVGVDIKPQPHYCGDEFYQADALTYPLEGFDAYHASPPCQGYSIMRNLPWHRDKEYPLLIGQTRERLQATGKPYVIENVMGAHLEAAWLCGGMFGLSFYRHRAFETNFFWLQPGHPKHRVVIQPGKNFGDRGHAAIGYGNGAQRVGANEGHAAGVGIARDAMGIDWMNRDEITQAIPPAYTEFIGGHLIKTLNGES